MNFDKIKKKIHLPKGMMMTSSKKTTIGALAGPPEQPVPITAHPLEYRIERQHLDTRKNIPWSSDIKRAAAKFWLTKFNTQHIGNRFVWRRNVEWEAKQRASFPNTRGWGWQGGIALPPSLPSPHFRFTPRKWLGVSTFR